MESSASSGARPPLGLKILGFEQHVAEVAKRGQRKQQQGNHHGKSGGLDVVEKVNRAAEEPEAGQAGGREERGNKAKPGPNLGLPGYWRSNYLLFNNKYFSGTLALSGSIQGRASVLLGRWCKTLGALAF
jgi:hypothetical protein